MASRRNRVLALACALALAHRAPGQEAAAPPPVGPPPTAAPDDPAKPPLKASWNNGVFLQSADKAFVYHFGGSFQYDGAWYAASRSVQDYPGGVGHLADGVTPRRGRLRAEGTVYSAVDFMFELELFNGYAQSSAGPATVATTLFNPVPTNAYITLKDIPLVGNVRLGNQKEPISFEHVNSYRFLEFMERSYLFDLNTTTRLGNGYSPGVSVFRTFADDRVYTAAGLFKNRGVLNGVGVGDGQYAATGRITGLLVYRPDDKLFVHVGGAMSHRDPADGVVRVSVRDDIRGAPNPLLNLIADTGTLRVSSQDIYGLEFAAVSGPVTLQAEYLANVLNGATQPGRAVTGSPLLQGTYAEGLLFLTGESRTYNAKGATFNRVVPNRNFAFDPATGRWTGTGAFELACRYSFLDLDNRGVLGGRLNSVTLGLNWYLNPNAKLQLNYDYTYRDGGANPLAKGSIHAVGTRVALDF